MLIEVGKVLSLTMERLQSRETSDKLLHTPGKDINLHTEFIA